METGEVGFTVDRRWGNAGVLSNVYRHVSDEWIRIPQFAAFCTGCSEKLKDFLRVDLPNENWCRLMGTKYLAAGERADFDALRYDVVTSSSAFEEDDNGPRTVASRQS